MIKTAEALRTARGLLGTSYDELDCINLIKKVIRVSAGGEKSYTTAGTNALWESDKNSAKYRDLTWKQEGISGAKAGMLAFMGVGTGDVNHVGLVTEKGTVVHSSKSRGGTVETELTEKNGWNGLGECVSGKDNIERQWEMKELVAEINQFLQKLPEEKRCMFVLRYWYVDSIGEIADRLGRSENYVSVTLNRIRGKLHTHLTERGFEV